VAGHTSAGVVYYFFSDHLGTTRIVAGLTGTVVEDSDFYPFGGERVVTDTLNNNYKFTGHERDGESGSTTWSPATTPSPSPASSSPTCPLLTSDPETLRRGICTPTPATIPSTLSTPPGRALRPPRGTQEKPTAPSAAPKTRPTPASSAPSVPSVFIGVHLWFPGLSLGQWADPKF
jgi:hypothetical protein